MVGPEVSAHFFQGLESEISFGNFAEVTIPLFGQEVLYAVDTATRNEQVNFVIDVLLPSKLRSLVDPISQEVEVNLKETFTLFLLPMAFLLSRC